MREWGRQGSRTSESVLVLLLSPLCWAAEVVHSVWSRLTFHMSQSTSWQHRGTIDLHLANILMCTGMPFNQLLSQPFPVYFSKKKVCSCGKVSLSRFPCWQAGDGTAVSVCAQSSRTQVQTNTAPPRKTLLSSVSRPRQAQGQDCDWDSPRFAVTEWH